MSAPARTLRAALILGLWGPLAGPLGDGESGRPDGSSERERIYASCYPLAQLAQRIVGQAAAVQCLVPPGEDPRLWIPDRALVGRMQSARLVLLHGAAYESWPDYVSLPLARTVVTTRAFEDRLRSLAPGAAHTHGRGGPAQARSTIDPYSWLDPLLASEQASVLLSALQRALPAQAEAFERRSRALEHDLEGLHVDLMELTARLGGRTLLAAQPSYGYLAERYGWNVVNLPVDLGEPVGSELEADLRQLREASGARLMLCGEEPSPDVAAALAAIGLEAVVYGLAETAPMPPTAAETEQGGGDVRAASFVGIMRSNVARLGQAVR